MEKEFDNNDLLQLFGVLLVFPGCFGFVPKRASFSFTMTMSLLSAKTHGRFTKHSHPYPTHSWGVILNKFFMESKTVLLFWSRAKPV